MEHGLSHGDRRAAERGQIDPVQRPDPHRRGAGGQLSLLHHRAQRGRGGGARPPARAAGRDRGIQADHSDPHHLRRHRGAGEGRQQGRGARQPVPRQHPRGGRHRPCAALFRGRRHHPCRGAGGPGGRQKRANPRWASFNHPQTRALSVLPTTCTRPPRSRPCSRPRDSPSSGRSTRCRTHSGAPSACRSRTTARGRTCARCIRSRARRRT